MERVRSIDCISVCICTYRRPALLGRLLDAVCAQATDASFEFDIVVVDNDERRSAEAVVRERATGTTVDVRYDCEPQRNISLARNRAIRNATGNLVALIDDDECPVRDWLRCLHETLTGSGADGVMAPVLADFPPEAPAWLTRARVFERKRFATGTRIGAGSVRSGNALLVRALFVAGTMWFDPALGRTGGEDSEFFTRQLQAGRVFVWCDEAIAYEAVPPDRWGASFHIKRLWRSGTLSGRRIREGRLPSTLLATNAMLLGAYTAAAPISLVLPTYMRMRVAQKLAYCAGVLTAYLGLSTASERE